MLWTVALLLLIVIIIIIIIIVIVTSSLQGGADDPVLGRVARDYELLFRGFYSELRHRDELSFRTLPQQHHALTP
jgi:hypothetical protein